jgi:hypothetical protein
MVSQVAVHPGGIRHFATRCPNGERLVAATHAIGFAGATPPSVAAVRSVLVAQHVAGERVTLAIRAGPRVHAIVQLDLLCGGAA